MSTTHTTLPKNENAPRDWNSQGAVYLNHFKDDSMFTIMPQEQQFVTKNHLLTAALSYAKAKHPIFPVKEGGKTPLTPHGLKDASLAVATITQWWQQWPQANIGLCTGSIAGFFVLDIDGADGEASLAQLEQAYALLPPTVEAITGGGGRHLYFQMPQHHKISCSAGKIGLGLDIRGDGGYIIAPPSIHPSGKTYAWSVDCANALAKAPEWLLRLIQTPATQSKQNNEASTLELVKGVSEGQRNGGIRN